MVVTVTLSNEVILRSCVETYVQWEELERDEKDKETTGSTLA